MAVDRQSLVFFIIIFLFLSLPNGSDKPHSYQERQTLITFQQTLKQNQQELMNHKYELGYGNITGFLLSYDDMMQGKSPLDWPLHRFDDKNPWEETEKYSMLPNLVSDEVKKFWGVDPIDINNEDSLGYLLNVSGKAYGEFEKSSDDEKLKSFPLRLPGYLQKYYESINQGGSFNENADNDNNDKDNDDDNKNIKKNGDIKFDNGKLQVGLKSLGYNYNNPELSRFVKNPNDRIDDAVLVKLKMNILDQDESEFNEIDSNGVYFQNTGSIVSITNSAKFLGNYALPQFTMNSNNFEKSKILMSQLLNGTDIDKQVSMDDMNMFISKSIEQCEFINFIQLDKTEYSIKELKQIDDELVNPTGRPITKNPPKIRIKQSLMYSPDCGIVINSKPDSRFEGEKTELVIAQLRKMIIVFIALIGVQFYLFMNQIRISKTPGQLSNISSVTLMLLQYEDSLVALCFLFISTFFEGLYLLLACVALLTYIMCGVFEMGFLTQVMKTQLNERGTTWWQILRGNTTNNESGHELPRPATDPNNTNNNNTNNNTNNDTTNNNTNNDTTNNNNATTETFVNQDSNVWNSIFAPGFAVTIISTFLILNATMWRRKYRLIFEVVGVTLINSYWYPQFLRNTLKNRRVPFTWEFILGTSTIRLLPVIYLNLCKNPLRHEKNVGFVIFIVSWVAFQLILLYLQTIINPRFWINENWLPKAYNYHPIINLKDLEQGYGSDLLANINVETANDSQLSAGESAGANNKTSVTDQDNIIKCQTECAICMTSVELPIYKQDKPKTKLSSSNNKDYMITPCFHIFHTECLEDWMKYKLQCPVCRNGLPPV